VGNKHWKIRRRAGGLLAGVLPMAVGVPGHVKSDGKVWWMEMKRFMKGCGIIALTFVVVGVTLGMIGRTVAGQETINAVVEEVTGGRMHVDNGVMWRWGNTNFNIATDRGAFFVDQIGDVTEVMPIEGVVMSSAYQEESVFWGDNVKEYLASDIRKLDIDMAGGYLFASLSGDDQIYVETYGTCIVDSYVEEGTLYLRADDSVNGWIDEDWTVNLYLPENYLFEEVDLEMGAGELYFDGLCAKEVSLQVGAGSVMLDNIAVQDLETSVGAGEITLTGMDVRDLDVEVGMGQFTAEGAVNGDICVECSMGCVDLGLAGKGQDFNYQLEGSMGNIVFDGVYSNGFAKKQQIDNGASKNMDIECSMGSVSVWFMD